MSRRARTDAGATTVEFALVLPVFLALLGIGAYFSWMFFVQSQLDRAANRAARYAAVPTTTGSYDYCQGVVVRQLNANLFTGSLAVGDVTISDGTGAVLSDGGSPVTDETACRALRRVPSGFVKVKATHSFTNPFSFLLVPLGGSGALTVTGTGQVRVERQ